MFDPEHIYGPDAYGGRYKAVRSEYDAELDRTTIWFEVYYEPEAK
jgi:hypothetical protein